MKKETLDWFEIKNWFSIITSAIMVALAFGMVNTRLALIEQKITLIADQQNEMIMIWKSVETRYGLLALDVKELQTLEKSK
ncbi:MAG TPA: hypothetical protein ENI23_11550 [bacterium]|nr:hypothetical protein [bacterium]